MWIFPSLPLWARSNGLLEIGDASPLRARLKDAARPLHRVVKPLAQIDRQATGLFAVNVLAGLGGHHRGRSVPAVARGDQHGVDVLAIEQLAKIADRLAVVVSVVLVDQRLARLATARLNVGDHHALHVGHGEHRLDIVGAPGPDADHAQRDLLARRHSIGGS